MKQRPPVLTKRDFVKRYAALEFGNRPATWNTLSEVVPSSTALYNLRNRVAGGETWMNLTYADLVNLYDKVKSEGRASQFYISEMAPTKYTTFQGEVFQTEYGLRLWYTRETLPMRDALRLQSCCCDGIMACQLLRHELPPDDWNWLQFLLDEYPGHVVEFSTYRNRCGVFNQHTMFWEVRKY
jgi:hypothetical protein